MKTPSWKKAILGVALGVLLFALAQVEWYPPDFGPYEAVRQQAHVQCQAYQAQGVEAYRRCLAWVSGSLCNPSLRDPSAYVACQSAIFAGYPLLGQPVLTAPSYRVEVAGGFTRELDPTTGQVRRQTPVGPRVEYTLQRMQNGLYRGVSYSPQGQPQASYWVTPACEIVGRNGQPVMDGNLCPVFPEKPYLIVLIGPTDAGIVPVPAPVIYERGRLLDDFDKDGVVEIGYLTTTGGSGRDWGSGGVEAFGYDPNTKRLKFHYILFGHKGGTAGNFLREMLVLYRVR